MKRLQHRLHTIIYEADTSAGKLFDVLLLITILLSVFFVSLESIESINNVYSEYLNIAEWVVTILFSIEYFLRIICVRRPLSYIFSFYGIIDFISIVPKYLSLIIIVTNSLVALKALRLLRVFRILKLAPYIGESNALLKALKASGRKIFVFLFSVVILCVIFGTLMYLIESEKSGFTSIPISIYWCIVTLTTVGYGDIAPLSPFGQFLASIIMVLGYGIIAVPTGIVTAEMTKKTNVDLNTQSCPYCMNSDHKEDAIYCHECGKILNDEK